MYVTLSQDELKDMGKTDCAKPQQIIVFLWGTRMISQTFLFIMGTLPHSLSHLPATLQPPIYIGGQDKFFPAVAKGQLLRFDNSDKDQYTGTS